jgi:uncharacterized RDD family membrane protein YckC
MAEPSTPSHVTRSRGGGESGSADRPPASASRRPDGPAAEWLPASLSRRFVALLADWVLCLLVSRLFANPVTEGWAPVGVLVVEYTFFIGLFGQTPGMRLGRLRCVGVGTGRPVGIPRALLRAVLLALVVPALVMDGRRRGLHDRAAGTIVLGPPTDEPTAGEAAPRTPAAEAASQAGRDPEAHRRN